MRAGYQRPTDAARTLTIKPVTYRTYEHGPADGGRSPPLPELQRMARKFHVSWTWILNGTGNPDEGLVFDARLDQLNDAVSKLPAEKRDDAIEAALGVVKSFARRA